MDEFVNLIAKYGLDAVALAAVTVLLTGILKMPVKALAKRIKHGNILKRFIVFIPLAVSFAVTVLYAYLTAGEVCLERPFFTLWLSAAGASLAVYAVWEKLFPSKKKIITESEAQENIAAIEKLQTALGVAIPEKTADGQTADGDFVSGMNTDKEK